MRTFECKTCKIQFQSKKADHTRIPKYCSQKCCGIGKAKFKKCPECKKEFYYWRNKHCSRKCASLARIGTKQSETTRKRLSDSHKGKRCGELNNLWKGGVTPINKAIRTSTAYKEWRTAVFKRDNYTCQICGIKGKRLNADHIKRFSDYKELRLALENGRTLCESCHKKTDTYGKKSNKQN